MAAVRLEFRNVTRRFAPTRRSEGVTAIEGVSIVVHDREVVSLIGPSGCGKSTLLNLSAGLDGPSAGEVYVDGAKVTGPNSHVAFMLQKDLLLPWRSVLDNVTLGLEVRGTPSAEARDRAMALIRRYGLAGFESARPRALSGGMRQRVAFMRTLALDPKAILLDEPFSALDFQTRLILQGDVKRIIREQRKAAILVTHDIGEGIAMSDRVLVLSQRPGTVKAIHDIDLGDATDPGALRRSSAFNEYFDTIWRQLDGHVLTLTEN